MWTLHVVPVSLWLFPLGALASSRMIKNTRLICRKCLRLKSADEDLGLVPAQHHPTAPQERVGQMQGTNCTVHRACVYSILFHYTFESFFSQ